MLGDLAYPPVPSSQGVDGLWRSSLLDPAHFPNPETTGSSCFTYMLAWGINAGLLDAATYLPVVEAAWTGLATISLQVRREAAAGRGEGDAYSPPPM